MTTPVPLRRPFPFLLHRTMAEVMRTRELMAKQWDRTGLTPAEAQELRGLAKQMGEAGIGPGGIAWGKPK